MKSSVLTKVLGRKVSTITSFYSRYVFKFGLPTKEKIFNGLIKNEMGRFIKQIVEFEPRIVCEESNKSFDTIVQSKLGNWSLFEKIGPC